MDSNVMKRTLLGCCACVWFVCYIFLLIHWLLVRVHKGGDAHAVYDNKTTTTAFAVFSNENSTSSPTALCQHFMSLDSHDIQLCEDNYVRICSLNLETTCNVMNFLDLATVYIRVRRVLTPIST